MSIPVAMYEAFAELSQALAQESIAFALSRQRS